MSTVNDIRERFLSYFVEEGHEAVASGPLVPRNDPTLMFTNAGMVQFKDYFTGRARPPFPRAATSQKCVRAGGKHNDLDNVGYTARHHTFFEMLGNFSFGDYFKDRAIELAWRLVTKEYGLPADRLMVTVFSEDDEAASLWKRIAGLPEEKIVRIPTSDNFWSMGDTGPCGPCSEIFFDHGEGIPGGPPGSADADGDRFIEIWNLVFMQFEQVAPGERVALPRPSIDTGMGLERIAAVLQGVHDNYDIDLFRALIGAIEAAVGRRAEPDTRASYRVIADHLRATGFLVADGVLPSNEGRGYVLRRIMRRAMRHANRIGATEPVIHRLVPTLVREMGGHYPELRQAEALIAETIRLEEIRFARTLSRGLVLLDEATADLSSGATLSGETAFKLYDTYGFPLDLTQDALRPRGIGVDLAGFDAAMERQKTEARANWAGSGESQTEAVWYQIRDRVGPTEFLGYDTERAEGRIVAIVRDGAELTGLKAGDEAALILNQTPFYAESGGQQGDQGLISGENGAVFRVRDTQKRADGVFVHLGALEAGELRAGDAVALAVDHERRSGLRGNHSATHLIHAALRRLVGSHIAQKGSLVAPNRLRFDFSHPKPLSADEIAAVEALANAKVVENSAVETRLMDRDAAVQSGAMALFGEKYGDEVRVISMGEGDEGAARRFSVELCGGTHVGRTGEIGAIAIVSEGAVASGVRRVEALSGEAARRYLAEQDRRVRRIADLLRVSPDDAVARVEALVEDRRRLERELAELRRRTALAGNGQAGASGAESAGARAVGSVRYLGRAISDVPVKDLRGLVDQGKREVGSGVVALVTVNDGKAGLVVGVTDDLTDRLSAVDLARAGSEALGGKGGGGRPDMAQAGGPDGAKAAEAIEAIARAIEAAEARAAA